MDTTNNIAWEKIKKRFKAALTSNTICYGNDFVVDLQFDGEGTPIIYVMDKTHLIFKRVEMVATLEDNDGLYILDSTINQLEKGLIGWTRRGDESLYQQDRYGHAGSVTGNAISLVRQVCFFFQSYSEWVKLNY